MRLIDVTLLNRHHEPIHRLGELLLSFRYDLVCRCYLVVVRKLCKTLMNILGDKMLLLQTFLEAEEQLILNRAELGFCLVLLLLDAFRPPLRVLLGRLRQAPEAVCQVSTASGRVEGEFAVEELEVELDLEDGAAVELVEPVEEAEDIKDRVDDRLDVRDR